MRLIEYPDREMMMIELAGLLAEALGTALQHKERATLVVPGGSTPGPIFDDLSAADLSWERVDVMLSDERWVSESSERSNTRLLRERLLVGRAAAARLLPLYAQAPRPEDALPALTARILPALPADVLLLGMGADMHTASLFPGAERLAEALSAGAAPLMAMRAPGAPEPRITLTAPVLQAAMATHVVLCGPGKRKALDQARKLKDALDAPIRCVLNTSTFHWAE